MPDKCKTCRGCGGSGFVFGIGTPGLVLRCAVCHRFESFDAMKDHIRLCGEAHDGLVAACKEGLRVLNTQHLGDHSVLAEMEAAIVKAQPVKESVTT